jgi:hypothetical protein
MFMSLKLENQIKKGIVEGYSKVDILQKVRKEYGQITNIEFWYDLCYNTVCKELGIDRKHGKELKPTKVKLILNKKEGDDKK